MSFEIAAFRSLKAMYTADSGSGGLTTLLSPGAFVHADEPDRNRFTPRIEVSFSPVAAEDGSGIRAESSLVRLSLYVKRDIAFGAGDTPETNSLMDQVLDRIETVFNGAKPGNVSPWNFSRLGRARTLTGPQSADEMHRVVEFLMHGEAT